MLFIALPVSASTYQGELTGCVISPFKPTSEMRQALDYAYSLLGQLYEINNSEWIETLDSIRNQLNCINANFLN